MPSLSMKNTRAQRGKTPDARFDEKLAQDGDCVRWVSAIGKNGYGVFWLDGDKKSVAAHRYAYMRANNLLDIPLGMCVLHLCNNKWCVNPKHLSLGTSKDNALQASRDGLMPRGEKNGGGQKLTEADVRIILADRSMSISKAAARFGVSERTIKMIRRRALWRHVEVNYAVHA